MKKSIIILLTLVVAFGMLFAGCDKTPADSGETDTADVADTADAADTTDAGDTANTDETDEPAEPVTIEFWWAPTFTDEQANIDWIDGMLADFYAENPHVTVNYTLIPWAEYASKLALALSNGEDCPDIFYSYPEMVWEHANAGWLTPLDPYFTDDDKKDFLGFNDGSWQGEFYMAPILYAEYAYVYNGDILDKIGWDRNALPTSLEEMDELFELANADGYWAGGLGLNMFDHLSALLHYSWGTGKGYVSRDGVVTTLDNAALKKVFEYQVKWVENGYIDPQALVMGTGGEHTDVSRFLKGDAVMNFTSAMDLKNSFQGIDIDWVIGPYPKAEPSANNTGVGIACGFVMTDYCEEQALAGEIINILTSADGQVSFNNQVGYMCARKSCGNIFADLQGFDDLAAVYADLDDSYGATWHFITSTQANNLMAERQGMYAGTQTVDETLQNINDLLQEAIDAQ